MSEINFNPDTIEITDTTQRYQDGHPAQTYRYEVGTKETEPGTFVSRRAENIETADGFLGNPIQSNRRVPIDFAICAHCARPVWQFPMRPRPMSGVTRMDATKLCHNCGVRLCPKHRRRDRAVWRCWRCSRWHFFWRIVLFPFVKTEYH